MSRPIARSVTPANPSATSSFRAVSTISALVAARSLSRRERTGSDSVGT
jgi:hypothetical protein